jgi:pimeloyl-ACP methyl ester carboxylesterase
MALPGISLGSSVASSVTADLVIQATTGPCPRKIRPVADARMTGLFASDGVKLAAWLVQRGKPRGTVVLAHGYRDDRRQLMGLAPALLARGYRVLAFDFRAHGESEGDRITLGISETRDVSGALQFARSFEQPVYYVGFSMGAAAYLLGKDRADAAVIDSPYDTLRTAVEERLRTFGAPRAVRDEVFRRSESLFGGPVDSFRPVDEAARLTHPAMYVFCSGDFWVRKSARRAFARVLPASARYVEVLGMGHSRHFTRRWIDRVVSFVESV